MPMTFDEAKAKLQQIQRELGIDFSWLLNGPDWLSAKQIADALEGTPLARHKDTVARQMKTLPSTREFGGAGLRAKRDELIVFFAGEVRDVQSA